LPLYNAIVSKFLHEIQDENYEVLNIQCLQNRFLWQMYQTKRKCFSETLGPNGINERYLWHGSSQDIISKICVQGFLRDFSTTTLHGRGIYFAKDCEYSIQTRYAQPDKNKIQQVLLCRVLLGQSCQGISSYKMPPSKPNSDIHYESMIDNIYNPSIFVISKDYQAYPEFIITFRKLEPTLKIDDDSFLKMFAMPNQLTSSILSTNTYTNSNLINNLFTNPFSTLSLTPPTSPSILTAPPIQSLKLYKSSYVQRADSPMP